MTRRYETVFILTPVLSAEQVKETVVKFKESLKGFGAKLLHEEDWGLKKLAYPIQKKSTGFYHLFEYEAEGEKIANMEVNLKRDEKVMRFLTVSMDKHAIAFAESRKTRTKKD
ncbi:MAG: 30S ribosomal protein S6 [Flavobacteriales bacterium CG_4_10_14_0_2_um_filter_32_8]|nr:MAG: 30S ribosomal protein S6 [Flavobacteriales bacterium CG_4_10_14_0_2_um_filter_32_8]PJB16355.1 MAG: 30S ribosomal protein S6 [Flavobacteriales bacterium CG_4_9_14_3_um_filter_32_8]